MKKMKNWFMNTPWAPFVVGPVVLLSIILLAIFTSPKILVVFPIALLCLASGALLWMLRDAIRGGIFGGKK